MKPALRYKVAYLNRTTGAYSSAFARGYSLLEYRIGEVTKARPELAKEGYHPAVFRTALQAYTACPAGTVLLCECTGPQELPRRLNLNALEEGDLSLEAYEGWPKGTEMYEEVKPIKIVQFERGDMKK